MAHIQEQLSSLFDWLLGASFQAVILVLLILVLQAVLRRRLEARWHCALWLILAVRLALPWAPPSRLSLFNWVPSFTETADPQKTRASAITDTSTVVPPLLPAAVPPASPSISEPGVAGDSGTASSAHATAGRLPSTRRLAEWLWLTAVGGLACWTVFANVRLWRRVRAAAAVIDAATLQILWECSRQMGLKSPPRLVETGAVPMPSLYGVIRPRLLMPTGLVQTLSNEQLRHVLLHEMAHLKRFDTAVSLLAAAVQILHWFNPLVWLAFRRMRDDRELACDALALSCLRRDETRAYAETLIRLAERFGRRPWQPGVAGILEGTNGLTRRITMISRFKGTRRGSQLFAVILLGILGCAALTDARTDSAAEPKTASPSPDKAQTPGDSGKAVLPEGSYINDKGMIVDKTDYLFVNDPEAVGKWESVDFVKNIDDFNASKPRTASGKLFLKGLVFYEGGRASFAWKGWTKGLVMHDGDKTASKYVIKDIGGTKYMFFEWKSGDYTIRHRKPMLYVLKKLPADSTKFNNPSELYATDKMGPKAELSPDSRIGKNGRIIDKIDYPFVDDPQVRGKWESVDFVKDMKDFDPAKLKWKGDLFLKELIFLQNGRMGQPWFTWTKGIVMHAGDRTAPRYVIKEMNGTTYMFFEWKSGDYSVMHRKPQYYVLRKTSADVSSLEKAWSRFPSDQEFNRDLPAKVAQLDITKAGLDEVVKTFGEPGQYAWGMQTFERDRLPDRYIMNYPAGFSIFMRDGRIVELRFTRPGYQFESKLQVGSSTDDMLKVLGPPSQTVTGQKCEFKDRVLYQDMDGREGYGYYACKDRNVRMFLDNDKIIAVYVTRPESK